MVTKCVRPISKRDAITVTLDAAAITGVRLKSISSNILRAIALPPTSEMKKATVASSKDARKAKTAPEPTPGAMLGSVTW